MTYVEDVAFTCEHCGASVEDQTFTLCDKCVGLCGIPLNPHVPVADDTGLFHCNVCDVVLGR